MNSKSYKMTCSLKLIHPYSYNEVSRKKERRSYLLAGAEG